MNIDFQYFWKVFTSIAASLGIIVAFWEAIKKIKSNSEHVKEELKKREQREEALNILAENISVLTDSKQQAQDQELIKQGMLAMLRFRVNLLCTHIKEKGFMTIDEKIDLGELYSAYEALGGNSRTHELYEFTMKHCPIEHK